MSVDKFRWLAGVIAAHNDRTIVGRTRLQKEIKLLQRLGLPTDYSYRIHFYGPYSDGLQADIGVLEMLGLVAEEECEAADDSSFYRFKASEDSALEQVNAFKAYIEVFERATATVLELAATYDMFRELGDDHNKALTRLRKKKGEKCDDGRDAEALSLLKSVGLEAA